MKKRHPYAARRSTDVELPVVSPIFAWDTGVIGADVLTAAAAAARFCKKL